MSITAGIFMVTAIAGALLAVNLKNILHAIFGLAVTLFSLAALFLMLNSPFVAAMELLVYVGGISVAMIFAVMLSTVISPRRISTKRKLLAALGALLFFGGVALVVIGTDFGSGPAEPPDPSKWEVAELGRNLLDRYNLVFEALSVVLLVAIIGAVVISARDKAGTEEEAE